MLETPENNEPNNGSRVGSKLYLLGARQRRFLYKVPWKEEWNLYESALILELDVKTGCATTVVEYKSPPEACAGEHASNAFKAATLVGDTLYACTSTEVLIYQVPQFRLLKYISLPCFNDLHHVTPYSDGNLIVTSTGLDMVVKVTPEGEVLERWNVQGEDPWSRFSPEVDYRKVATTKPHHSHPNFSFELDGELWVTRAWQRDAICLTDPGRCIEISIETPHDGLVWDDKIYFTTVDGHIVIVNHTSLEVEEAIDLKTIDGQGSILGWCRGILPVDGTRCWVGFSQLRRTRFQENVHWVRNLMRDGATNRPTHIALYDIARRACLQEFNLENYGMNVVFSIFPTPHHHRS